MCARCSKGDHHWTPSPVDGEFHCFCCPETAEIARCESCSLLIPAAGALHDLEDGVYLCRACQDAIVAADLIPAPKTVWGCARHGAGPCPAESDCDGPVVAREETGDDIERNFKQELGARILEHEARKRALEIEAAVLVVKKAQLEADTAEVIKQHAVAVSKAFSLPKLGDLS